MGPQVVWLAWSKIVGRETKLERQVGVSGGALSLCVGGGVTSSIRLERNAPSTDDGNH